MKHTQGKWDIDESFDGQIRIYTDGIEQNIAVLNIKEGDYTDLKEENIKANAHLIAAAPELLEALDYILYAHDNNGNGLANCAAILGRQCLGRARAAIAKAKGE